MTYLFLTLPLYLVLIVAAVREVRRRRRFAAQEAEYAKAHTKRPAAIRFKPISVFVNGVRVRESSGFTLRAGQRPGSGEPECTMALRVLILCEAVGVDLLTLTATGEPVALTMNVEGKGRRSDGKFVAVEMTTDWKTGASLAEYTFRGTPLVATDVRCPDDGAAVNFVEGRLAIGEKDGALAVVTCIEGT